MVDSEWRSRLLRGSHQDCCDKEEATSCKGRRALQFEICVVRVFLVFKVEEVEINGVSDRPALTIVLVVTNEPETNVCRDVGSINCIITLSRRPKNDFREAKIGRFVFKCYTFTTGEVFFTYDRVVLIQNVSVDVSTVVTTREAFLISDWVAETGAVLSN